MKIVVLGTWHRRCGLPYYYARALRQLGHEVIGIGPWQEGEPPGTEDRQPEFRLPFDTRNRESRWYEYEAIKRATGPADLFLLAEGGEDLRLLNAPAPWVHVSTEGDGPIMWWSRKLTPFRYAEIMSNGADEGVRWLPKSYDALEHYPSWRQRSIDFVQLASPREARRYIWQYIAQNAPELTLNVGEAWGLAYGDGYRSGRATFCCSSSDFVTTRVFEAMACRCVVIADRTPSMLELFNEHEHFIGFDPVPGPGDEGMPDPAWLIDTLRKLKRDGDSGIANRAYDRVHGRDSYRERMLRILRDVERGRMDS